MLSMERSTFRRFLDETPGFPLPILLGKPSKRPGDRQRWRKEEVIMWIATQPKVCPDGSK